MKQGKASRGGKCVSAVLSVFLREVQTSPPRHRSTRMDNCLKEETEGTKVVLEDTSGYAAIGDLPISLPRPP